MALTYSHVSSPSALAQLPQGTALYYQEPTGQYVHIPDMQAYNQLPQGTAIYTAASAPSAPGTSSATPSAGSGSAALSAKAIITQTLQSYGLGDLADWAWNTYLTSGSTDYVWSQLPLQKQFQQRFPAYQQLAQEGRGISVAQYINYEQTIASAAQAAGFPQGTVNQNTITNWLLGDVSASEGVQRIQDASKTVYGLDKNSQDYLQFREAGFHDGDLAAVWFDPKTALPLLENKLAAAQIGGAAAGAGFDLSTNLADQLVRQGVSASQAVGGFGKLANDQQLTTALPGQQGPTMSQAQQVSGEFGTNASAAQQLAQTAAARKAVFSAGGAFTGNTTGYSGIGTAKSA